jgi:hypothetical protein
MLGHQFAYSAAPLRKVKEVQFGILSPEEIVSIPQLSRLQNEYSLICRKPIRSRKSNIPRSWMRQHGSLRWAVSWTREWAPSIVTSSARRAARECRSVLVTSVTSSSRGLCFILVSHHIHLILTLLSDHSIGFITKVKKILECICVNCGKLKADIVSVTFCCSRFVPHHPNFLGALSFDGEPRARAVFSPFSFERVFFRLRHGPWRCMDAVCVTRPAARTIMRCRKSVGRTARGEMGAERAARKTLDGWRRALPSVTQIVEGGEARRFRDISSSVIIALVAPRHYHDADIARSRTLLLPTRYDISVTGRSACRSSGHIARPKWSASLTSLRRRASTRAKSPRRDMAVVAIISRRSVRRVSSFSYNTRSRRMTMRRFPS